MEANQSPKEYLALLYPPHPDSLPRGERGLQGSYAHEVGLTPKAWIARFLHALHIENQVIDDWNGLGKLCYFLGVFHPASGNVSGGYWRCDYRRAYLGGFGPGSRLGDSGSRPAVRLARRSS